MDRQPKLAARVAELEAALERARVASEALRRVGTAVGTTRHLDELLELIVVTTTEVIGAERATLYLRDGERLVSRIKVGDEHQTIEVAVGQGIAGHVAKTGKGLRVADAYRDKRFDQAWDDKSGFRTRAVMAVPINGSSGDTLGVLQVLNKLAQPGKRPIFTPYDSELLTALAVQAAVSIDKASLIDRLRAKNEELADATSRLARTARDLELLYELEIAMSRSDSLSELARRVVTKLGAACEAPAGALLHAADDGTLHMFLVNLAQPSQVHEAIVEPGSGVAARAMKHNELTHVEGAGAVRDPRRVRELLGIRVTAALAAPLEGDGQAVGALVMYHQGEARFGVEDEYLLRLVSANVSTELRILHARQLRERADRLRSIGRLLSGVMHDLRTPLTVISGYVQLMQAADDAVKRREHGAIVAEQFELVQRMQSDLLAYARGETTLWVRKVYLSKFFEELRVSLMPTCVEAGVELELHLGESGVAFFDEGQMARAIHNLAQNALEAMEDAGGTLRLACRSEAEVLVFEVADTGPGIPKAIRERIFEPFVTAGKKMGTGLGLSNVKKIVDEHGGEISVRSSRKGTCFTVRMTALSPRSLRPGALV